MEDRWLRIWPHVIEKYRSPRLVNFLNSWVQKLRIQIPVAWHVIVAKGIRGRADDLSRAFCFSGLVWGIPLFGYPQGRVEIPAVRQH